MIRTLVSIFFAGFSAVQAAEPKAERGPDRHEKEIVIMGVEHLEPEVAQTLQSAARELLPRMIKEDAGLPLAQQRAHEDESIAELDELWLSDPAIAKYLEDVVWSLEYEGLELASPAEGFSLRDNGDRVSFRIDTPKGKTVITMIRDQDGFLWLDFVGTLKPNPTGAHEPLEVKMVNGRINVPLLKMRFDEQVEVGLVAAGAEAEAGTCATTPDGVCCSFTQGSQVRIVCMCRGSDRNAPVYRVCGDSGWMN